MFHNAHKVHSLNSEQDLTNLRRGRYTIEPAIVGRTGMSVKRPNTRG